MFKISIKKVFLACVAQQKRELPVNFILLGCPVLHYFAATRKLKQPRTREILHSFIDGPLFTVDFSTILLP